MVLGLSMLAACGNEKEQISTDPTGTAAVIFYKTATAGPGSMTTVMTVEATAIPQPTATPFVYKVVANDTLIGIAARFKVSLSDLLTANPGVDPSLMPVGTELVIPQDGESGGGGLPSPTPVAVSYTQPDCYATTDGGLWCFMVVKNDRPAGMENLAAMIRLYTRDGKEVASKEAIALLNLLPAGRQIPLMAFFTAPVPDWEFSQGELVSALDIPAGDERYLAVEIEGKQVEIGEDGLQARVQGMVRLSAAEGEAGSVWVVAVGYDADGRVVGVRRWESGTVLAAGKRTNFELLLYSLGPEIAQVDVLVEARP